MATDIFGRQPLQFNGAFAADSAIMVFTGQLGDLGAGLLAQSMQVAYQQPVIRLYELGAPFEYYVAGRSQGNGSLQRVIGPRAIIYAFYITFGDACNAANNSISITAVADCNNNSSGNNIFEFALTSCLMNNYGFSVAAADMVFNENIQFMFVSLELPV